MSNIHHCLQGKDIELPLVKECGFHNYLHSVGLRPHTHVTGAEITYLLKGDCCWQLDGGKELFLSGGSAAIVQADTMHHGLDNVISPCWLFWLILDLDHPGAAGSPFGDRELTEFAQIFQAAGNLVIPGDAVFAGKIEHLIGQFDAASGTDVVARASLRLALAAVVADAARIFRDRWRGTRCRSIARKTEKIMREHLQHKLCIYEIAGALKLTPVSFVRRFKSETGLTPADYFMRMKLTEARRRMSAANMSISQVAFDLGFSSSQHFSSVFKKYIGVSPGAFRAQNKKAGSLQRKI